MVYKSYDITLLIAIEIIKPTNPNTNMPMAETLEISLNSSAVGFLNILQTLIDCVVKDFNF